MGSGVLMFIYCGVHENAATALAGGHGIKTLHRPPGTACKKVQGISNPP